MVQPHSYTNHRLCLYPLCLFCRIWRETNEITLGISVSGFVIGIFRVVLFIGPIPISALGAITGILMTIAALYSVGTIATIEIATIIIILISFHLPHHTLIHWPLTYHSYHQPPSLPHIYQHLQSTVLLHSILQQHHLLHMSIPIVCLCLVHPESLLKNLQMESSSSMLCYLLSTSPSPSIGEIHWMRTCQNMLNQHVLQRPHWNDQFPCL